MRKIRIFEHTSLDGVIEHDGDYTYGANIDLYFDGRYFAKTDGISI